MSTDAQLRVVDTRRRLTPVEFYADYVDRQAVLLKGRVADLPAVGRWSVGYLGSLAPDIRVRLKTGDVSAGRTTAMPLGQYCREVAAWEQRTGRGEPGDRPPYLHDVPLLRQLPELRRDLEPFPANLLPRFYGGRWWAFTQFFVSPSGAQTPLHFDTLLTHNLFFQISGRKRFVMVDAADRDLCYVYQWRWSPIDPDAPDLERYPRFADARVRTCTVEAGDLLYMPPGTLHKVVSETASVSFNVDWHDRRSALRGVVAAREGMPLRNLRYNTVMGLGVTFGLPRWLLMPGLRSYYNYVS